MLYSLKPDIKVDRQAGINIFDSFLTRISDIISEIVGNSKSKSNNTDPEPDATSRSRKRGVQIQLPKLGEKAPDFSGRAVINRTIKKIKFKDYKGKYVVLFFYPLDFSFVCPSEIIAFSNALPEFQKINCELIAASTDSHYIHFAWVKSPRIEGGLGDTNIPLLSDKSTKIARAYGVYNEDTGIPYRGLFIIDEKQRLRQITINDLPVGRSVEETLRLVQAFQHSDKHGEGCPAGWKPGDKSIKADPIKSKEYFNSVN